MNERPSSLFRISYRLERGDHVARVIALTHRPLWHTLALAALYYGLLALLVLIQSGSLDSFAAELLRLLTAPTFFEVLPYLLPGLLLLAPASWLTAAIAALAYKRSGAANMEITLDVTADGIEVSLADRASRVSWAAISRLIDTPSHLFIQLSRREALIIPRRAVAGDDRYHNLVGFIRARTGLSTRPRHTQL